MKKIYLLLIGISLVSFNLSAQKWVSTTPQNKKVVLEEYTGIHCGYCPDGHRMATDLVTSNPGNVFLVNIHAGGYATPATGEPDFRTSVGTTLNGLAGITGYPSGSVNRSTTPWGQTRDLWGGLVSGILAQSSPVNVAVKSTVDFTTRTLTTEVEAYYTANSSTSTNYLTVMLLQSDYPGYQSDYGNYNPTNWCPNGDYKHNHVLRMVLSNNGATGETLDTTTSGKYYYKKYVTVLPASIVNVNIFLSKLSVVAFVAESQSQIDNAAEVDVPLDNTYECDLSLVDKTVKPASNCFTSINPKAEITNNSDKTITSFDASATIGGTNYPKPFSGSLAPGATTTIDWGNINYSPKGTYSFAINSNSNINGGALEDIGSCDNKSTFSGIGFTPKAFSTISAGSAGFNGVMPNNFAFDQSQNTGFGIVNGSGTSACGARSTTGAVRFSLNSSWNVSGLPGDILFGEADFTTLTKPLLTFYYAYSDDSYGGTAPTIKVSASEDCGATWNLVNSFVANQTGNPATHGNWYIPTSAQYIWVGVSLNAYAGKSVLLKVTGIPGTNGNALYIDEISISQSNGIADHNIGKFHFGVYPNPVSDVAQVTFSIDKTSNVSFDIYNSMGQKVLTTESASYNAGTQTFEVNTSNLEQGTYIGVLKVDGQTFSTKLVK